jgi:hypothetical protein
MIHTNVDPVDYVIKQLREILVSLEVIKKDISEIKTAVSTPESLRYPWDNAPYWANYAATDLNGEQWWFEFKPSKGETIWVQPPKGRCSRLQRKASNANFFWEYSLDKRPDKTP